MSNKAEVLRVLRERNVPENAVAGIMANIDIETGGSFDFKQKQIKGPGRGLFQLDPTGPLPKAYEGFKERHGLEDSAENQIDFMLSTIYGKNKDIIGPGHAAKLRKTFAEGSAEDVAKEFSNRWERPRVPHMDRRLEAARRLAEELANE